MILKLDYQIIRAPYSELYFKMKKVKKLSQKSKSRHLYTSLNIFNNYFPACFLGIIITIN